MYVAVIFYSQQNKSNDLKIPMLFYLVIIRFADNRYTSALIILIVGATNLKIACIELCTPGHLLNINMLSPVNNRGFFYRQYTRIIYYDAPL